VYRNLNFLNRKVYLTTKRFSDDGLYDYAVGYVIESRESNTYLVSFPETEGRPRIEIAITPDEFLVYEMYRAVRIRTGRFKGDGINEGAVGVVIEAYWDEDFLIDFSDNDGTTYAWINAKRDDFELIE